MDKNKIKECLKIIGKLPNDSKETVFNQLMKWCENNPTREKVLEIIGHGAMLSTLGIGDPFPENFSENFFQTFDKELTELYDHFKNLYPKEFTGYSNDFNIYR